MIPIFGGIFQGGGIFRMIRRILCNREYEDELWGMRGWRRRGVSGSRLGQSSARGEGLISAQNLKFVGFEGVTFILIAMALDERRQ